MIHLHDGFEYRCRALDAFIKMREPEPEVAFTQADWREIDAGYCLDSLTHSPAGCTQRVDMPAADGGPFAAPVLTMYRR